MWQINQSCHKMGHKCFLIRGDWLSCDPLRGSHDSQSPPYIAWPLALWLHIGPETGLWFLGCDWPVSIWFNLGVWLQGCSPIGRLSLGIPRRISSNCQYKQVRLVMHSFLKRCFNHLVWHKMLLSYNLEIVGMKLYYNYIFYHSQAYDFVVFIIISLYLVRCSTFISAQQCT